MTDPSHNRSQTWQQLRPTRSLLTQSRRRDGKIKGMLSQYLIGPQSAERFFIAQSIIRRSRGCPSLSSLFSYLLVNYTEIFQIIDAMLERTHRQGNQYGCRIMSYLFWLYLQPAFTLQQQTKSYVKDVMHIIFPDQYPRQAKRSAVPGMNALSDEWKNVPLCGHILIALTFFDLTTQGKPKNISGLEHVFLCIRIEEDSRGHDCIVISWWGNKLSILSRNFEHHVLGIRESMNQRMSSLHQIIMYYNRVFEADIPQIDPEPIPMAVVVSFYSSLTPTSGEAIESNIASLRARISRLPPDGGRGHDHVDAQRQRRGLGLHGDGQGGHGERLGGHGGAGGQAHGSRTR